MGLRHLSLSGAVLLACSSQSASALIINFDYRYDTNNFFSDPARKNILSEAGNFFGSRITDNLTAITSGGVNQFDAKISRPDTGALTTLNSFNVAADTLTVFVGGRDFTGNTLGQGGYGGWNASGYTDFFNNIQQRGQTGPTFGAGATDFAPWGGQISFDTSSTWYFDNNVATTETFSGSDFYSVALHEIGHLLGLGTAASWTAKETSGGFSGANAVASFGANIPLEADGAHWLNGTKSLTLAGVTQEAMMDPSITIGTRKLPTQLDLAALKDVGWQITPVPVPAAVWLFGSALLTFAGVRRKKAASV